MFSGSFRGPVRGTCVGPRLALAVLVGPVQVRARLPGDGGRVDDRHVHDRVAGVDDAPIRALYQRTVSSTSPSRLNSVTKRWRCSSSGMPGFSVMMRLTAASVTSLSFVASIPVMPSMVTGLIVMSVSLGRSRRGSMPRDLRSS
ncbi:hypothetical protein BSZ07_36210 [Streptomyces sp. M1013]|nr:hypothetical protein BSZ07_36210 [Streptomyces sp. M1013]